MKVDSDGAGYHILWGLTEDAVPTSELPAHFLSHSERIKLTDGKDRVIMHCHATNLIALTYVPRTTAICSPASCGKVAPNVWWSSRMASAFCRGWCRAQMKSAVRLRKPCKTLAGAVAVPRRLRQRPNPG